MKVLLLKLEGPMASFGDVAVDEVRRTASHPFKSMIVGLIGNALGYRRTEGDRLDALQSAISVASRLDRPGRVMTDYQTVITASDKRGEPSFVEVPAKGNEPSNGVWTSRGVHVRSFEGTIQVWRDYLTDVSATIAVASSDEVLISKIGDAVRKPARPLFLGRKSCPPSRPIFDSVVDSCSMTEALRAHPVTDGGEGRFSFRTEAVEKKHMQGHYREFLLRDLKNWTNGFHAAERPVVEGVIEIGA